MTIAVKWFINARYEKGRIELMGRHREFDVEKVLDAALCVFWRKGYEGASYADLTEAAGVERPALYSAFGNKEALFRRALERYYERYLDYIPDALQLPTSREVAERMLYRAADLNTRYPSHTGCLNINGALAVSDEAESVRQALIDVRAAGEVQFRERFERAKAEGDLPETAKPDALAAFLMAVLHGMAVQAKAGFSRDVLEAVAEQALSTWPAGGLRQG
ncbi:AcrR family transcriptional regulator [Shinella sp. BE166]